VRVVAQGEDDVSTVRGSHVILISANYWIREPLACKGFEVLGVDDLSFGE